MVAVMSAGTSQNTRDKLAVLLPGLGAVATTTIAGVHLVRKGIAAPVGALSQLRDRAAVCASNALASLDDLEFAAWDIFGDNALDAARHAGVLTAEHLAAVEHELARVVPMPGAFFDQDVPRLRASHRKRQTSRAALCDALRDDIRSTVRDRGCTRAVAVWCGSTERHRELGPAHANVASFEAALAKNDESITATQLYAWACLKERVPFANASPNHAVDFPAALELARELRVPVAGKDLKTGQTLLKTAIAPALRARALGMRGWYSTNILGNRDGEVLDEPGSFRAKEITKSHVLDAIFNRDVSPTLYGDLVHKVRIDYFGPRGDAKESWDSIDFFGWLGYPMQLKVNLLARDSILAAPLVLDLALFLDAAMRRGEHGASEWLGFYFKEPLASSGEVIHDVATQHARLLAHLAAWS